MGTSSKRNKKKRARRLVGWDDELWNLRFAELQDFIAEKGHALVPARWERNMPLGRWLAHQRELARAGAIEPDRARQLQKLGVEWVIGHRDNEAQVQYWEKMLARLAAHVKKHGHAGVERSEDPELARWIGRQRGYRKTGQISESRLQRLEEAGFPWEHVDPRWEERYRALVDFRQRFGHVLVPARWETDPVLGRWLHHQRKLGRSGEIGPDHARRLQEVGVTWEFAYGRGEAQDRRTIPVESRGAYMEQMLARLAAHVEKHGHAGVERSQDHALARWMQRQRIYRKKGQLSESRLRRLNEAGFPWDCVDPLWEERYRTLVDFRERFGHVLVPARWTPDPALGRWLAHQREIARAGRIPDEHGRRLRELGVVWGTGRVVGK